MQPGPNVYRSCSLCGKPVIEETLWTGNTLEARYWTDGKMDAPMLPEFPLLAKCPHCGGLIWVQEQTKLGELFWNTDKTMEINYPDAKIVGTPSLEDYAAFLAAGIDDTDREFYVRERAWWKGNDPRREPETPPAPLSAFEVENLRALLPMLDETKEEQCLMKAEILRELGEFSEAEKVIPLDYDNLSWAFVGMIFSLILDKTACVAEIPSDLL
jgi:hypothetical protein